MKVLVTGANSMLGANTIAVLLHNNYEVRGMVRQSGSIPLKNSKLEEYVGRITLKEEVCKAACGCDVIIHIAAFTDQNAVKYGDYARVNVEGTRNVLDAAKENAVKRTILVSTANTLGFGSLETPGTEVQAMRYPFTQSCYARSKMAAESIVPDFPGKDTGDIIIVNPTFMLGSYDAKPGSGKIILRGYRKRIVFIPPGGKNFIHVKDVALAICNAINSGTHKSRYLLANENMSYKAFYQLLDETTGHKSIILTIPKGILLAIGILGSLASRIGIKTAMHYNNMRILCVNNYYSNKKAIKDIQLKTTPIKTAIHDAVEWFKQSGMLLH